MMGDSWVIPTTILGRAVVGITHLDTTEISLPCLVVIVVEGIFHHYLST